MQEFRDLPQLYFSYGQFSVYDQSEIRPGCAWTTRHSSQGFARRHSTVAFATILEFGDADIKVILGSYQPLNQHQRAIAVPFQCESGIVIIEGPDEYDVGRQVMLAKGPYRLTAAQSVTGDESEEVELYFDMLTKPLSRSQLIIIDDLLDPPSPLLESAEFIDA
jgi:Competence protein J (ComJ)